MAVVAAAVASSLLAFASFVMFAPGRGTGTMMLPAELAVTLAVVMFWGPAFALVPVSILGFLVERPLSRQLVERKGGGFITHLMVLLAASLALWLMLRVAVVAFGPQDRIMDPLSLVLFLIIGLCSALSWWFLVVLPGRHT